MFFTEDILLKYCSYTILYILFYFILHNAPQIFQKIKNSFKKTNLNESQMN